MWSEAELSRDRIPGGSSVLGSEWQDTWHGSWDTPGSFDSTSCCKWRMSGCLWRAERVVVSPRLSRDPPGLSNAA